MRPWLDHHNHRMWITKLSTTNNRTLAWLKFAHPDWSRYDELKKNLTNVIIQNSDYQECEIDLRPRKTRVGRGPNAVFVYAITISCSVKNIEKYMEALILGYSSGQLPHPLKHTEIIPFQGISRLVTNEAVIAHATEHNQVITRLRKHSIFGFHDIFAIQQTAPTFTGDKKEISLHEALTKIKSRDTGGPLFQSIESRGKSGFLIIYFDSYDSEVMEAIDDLRPHIKDTFLPEFLTAFFRKINTNPSPFLQYSDDQSEVSQLSTAETYYTKIQPGSTIYIPPAKEVPQDNTATSVPPQPPLPKRSFIQLNYGDEVSSLGSKSANQLTWASVVNNKKDTSQHNNTPNSSTPDDMTIATMKSELQALLEDSKRDMEKQLTIMREQNEQAQAAITLLQKQHEATQQAQAQELETYKDKFRSDLLTEISNCIQVSVRQQFNAHLENETPIQSPVRKLPKNDDGEFSTSDSTSESFSGTPESINNSYHTPAKIGKTRSRTGQQK